MWRRERAEEVFLSEEVDAVLHADPRIVLRQHRAGHADQSHAAMHNRRGEAHDIEHRPAANGDDVGMAIDLTFIELAAASQQVVQLILAGFATFDDLDSPEEAIIEMAFNLNFERRVRGIQPAVQKTDGAPCSTGIDQTPKHRIFVRKYIVAVQNRIIERDGKRLHHGGDCTQKIDSLSTVALLSYNPDMELRTFGKTNVRVSAVSLGCWIFGVDWWGHYSDERAIELCKFSMDHGITFFDNGDAYGNGRAEMLFGKFLKTVQRDSVQIGGKFGYDFYTDPGTPGSHKERKQDFSPAFLRLALENSLQRLGVDMIDIYMAHNIKLPQFRDDLFAELEKVKAEGKIRAWGVSLGPAIGWREEGVAAMMEHGAQAVQTVYNLFEQNPGREFCEVAKATGAGVLARVHDNSSILKDKVKIDTTIGPDDHRKFRDQAWKIYGIKKLDLIRHYAADHDMNMHQLACKWLLQQPALTSITGTFLNEAEIAEACAAVDKSDFSFAELHQLAEDYSVDWNLGTEAHPCDLKSSVEPAGLVRSGYVPPAIFVA